MLLGLLLEIIKIWETRPHYLRQTIPPSPLTLSKIHENPDEQCTDRSRSVLFPGRSVLQFTVVVLVRWCKKKRRGSDPGETGEREHQPRSQGFSLQILRGGKFEGKSPGNAVEGTRQVPFPSVPRPASQHPHRGTYS